MHMHLLSERGAFHLSALSLHCFILPPPFLASFLLLLLLASFLLLLLLLQRSSKIVPFEYMGMGMGGQNSFSVGELLRLFCSSLKEQIKHRMYFYKTATLVRWAWHCSLPHTHTRFTYTCTPSTLTSLHTPTLSTHSPLPSLLAEKV